MSAGLDTGGFVVFCRSLVLEAGGVFRFGAGGCPFGFCFEAGGCLFGFGFGPSGLSETVTVVLPLDWLENNDNNFAER